MAPDKQTTELRKLCSKYNIKMNFPSTATLHEIIQNHIQTQAATDTIIIAKRSCLWAALAAVCSLLIILMTINYEIVLEIIFSLLHWISCLI